MKGADVFCHRMEGMVVAVIRETDGQIREVALLAGVSPSDESAKVIMHRSDDTALLDWVKDKKAAGELDPIGTTVIEFVD